MESRPAQFLNCPTSALPLGWPAAQDQKGSIGAEKTVLIIHAGAGVLNQDEMEKENLTPVQYEQALRRALVAGYQLWKEEKSSTEVVEAAIRVMEDCDLFNAGKGAAFNSDGRIELDAAIMEGDMTDVKDENLGKKDPRKRAGAVAAVTHIKNPISAARAIMEDEESRAVILVGAGAEAFALSEINRRKYRIERVSNTYFWTERRLKQILPEASDQPLAKDPDLCQVGTADGKFGTVGAVSVSKNKKLAVGTSTGGLSNKLPGRVGDSCIIGAGTYADDRVCGVSCTGTGEIFIRHAVAHEIVAKMRHDKQNISAAVNNTIAELPDETGGVGGVIALDPEGNHAFAMSPNCIGMYRGYVTESGDIYVAIYRPKGKADEFTVFHVEDKHAGWNEGACR